VRLLGGIGGFKKVTHGATTAFGAFCSKKLHEMNIGVLFSLIIPMLHGPYILLILGKEVGHMTTLPKFLKSYSKDKDMKNEYKACNKKALLVEFDGAKQAKEYVLKKLSNVAISKAVSLKLERITTYVCVQITFLMCFLSLLVPGPQ
jgi:hypothetical protein